jgi:hypothetical protein
MPELMLMATHHNREQSGIRHCPFYFACADKATLSSDDLAGKHVEPCDSLRQGSLSHYHAHEKETHLPLKPKQGPSKRKKYTLWIDSA